MRTIHTNSKLTKLCSSLFTLSVLSACGGGLVEQAQPTAEPAPTQTTAAEPVIDTALSSRVPGSMREQFEAQDIELLILASKAYIAALPPQPAALVPAMADLSAGTAFFRA